MKQEKSYPRNRSHSKGRLARTFTLIQDIRSATSEEETKEAVKIGISTLLRKFGRDQFAVPSLKLFHKITSLTTNYHRQFQAIRDISSYKINHEGELQLRKQLLKLGLIILKVGEFRSSDDQREAFKHILELIGQEVELKAIMIRYLVDNLQTEFYDEKQLYLVYRQPGYEHLLYEDYTTSDMLVRLFSVKTISYLADSLHSPHTFFLKNAYKQLSHKLAVPQLITPAEKQTTLKLIREVMRHRAELFSSEADDLAVLLIDQIHSAIEFSLSQTASIVIEILKIFQALMEKLPVRMQAYARPLVHYVISIINQKATKKKVKRRAIEAFSRVTYHCKYVILPYFHFKNLYPIIRELLRSDQHYYYYQIDLMRLIGSLGFVEQDDFIGLHMLNSAQQTVPDRNFERLFAEIGFIRESKARNKEVKIKEAPIEDPFYSEEKVSKSWIEIERYVFYLLSKIVSGLRVGAPEAKIKTIMSTLAAIITVLEGEEDQYSLQALLLPRLMAIQPKHPNQMLDIVILLIQHQKLAQTHAQELLTYLLDNAYQHKRQLDMLQAICVLTKRHPNSPEGQLVSIVRVCKRIIADQCYVEDSQATLKVQLSFSIIMNLADKVDSLLHLFFMDVIRLFSGSEQVENGRGVGQQAAWYYLTLLVELAQRCPSVQYYLPSIRQCVLGYFKKEIQKVAETSRRGQGRQFLYKIINCMICLMVVYGRRCESFIGVLQWQIKQHKIFHVFYRISEEYFKKHANLDCLSLAFQKHQLSQLFFNDIPPFKFKKAPAPQNPSHHSKIVKELDKMSIQGRNVEEQEALWLENLTLQLFRNSAEPILRGCSQLVAYDKLFSHDLFDVPFYFFWKQLQGEQRRSLTLKIKNILTRKSLSVKIRQTFLDAVYFIQRSQIPFMVKDKILSDVAVDVEDQVKALFYLQREYENDPDAYCEQLIEKYDEIGEKQSANGLFQTIKRKTKKVHKRKMTMNREDVPQEMRMRENVSYEYEEWLRKERLDVEDSEQLQDIKQKKAILDWEGVMAIVNKEGKTQAQKSRLAQLAVEASVNLGKWDQVKAWAPVLQQSKHTEDTKLLTTMLQIHEGQYDEALTSIKDMREMLYAKTRQMFNFSYQKSMREVILLQQICEAEEVVRHLRLVEKAGSSPSSQQRQALQHDKAHLVAVWKDRFVGLKTSLSSMQKVLFVRGILLTKKEDIENWISYCRLALRQHHTMLGTKIHSMLQKIDTTDDATKLQLLFIEKEIQSLNTLTNSEAALSTIQAFILEKKLINRKDTLRLIFDIYRKYAQRIIEDDTAEGKTLRTVLETLGHYPKSRDYYELAHLMGLTHMRLSELYQHSPPKRKPTEKKTNVSANSDEQQSGEMFRKKELEGALRCFINSVTSSTPESKYFLEDCLKILNLISMGNDSLSLIEILEASYRKIPSQGLIEFLPQIIARLDDNWGQSDKYIQMLKSTLKYVGTHHPQTLLFPLIFLRQGSNEFKKKHADQIYKALADQQPAFAKLYGEAEVIVQELCKISLRLSEKVLLFMKRMEDVMRQPADLARKTVLAERCVNFCQRILGEHQRISSQSEFGFIQEEKQSLVKIIESMRLFTELREEEYYGQAKRVIERIALKTEQTLQHIRKINIEEASSKLASMRSSRVCLFGLYNPRADTVSIEQFRSQVQIISSKQRPKKIVLVGSDGKEYNYLLKGKEDLRLDERIMQLFTFINKMFHSPSQQENYAIHGYSITPISAQIGVIAWVEDCDTLGDLVIGHRTANGMTPKKARELEHSLCLEECPSYDHLPNYQKVQIYRQICTRVSGNELKTILWKRAITSEHWLKDRSRFIRSLAVMSMVGYIIGLGDRHPNNIMLQRSTGKIVHIDFGDCFEVTKMRKHFPERVPFRLTRMLVNAMEACKTEGIFKHTCQKIMKMMRSNKESILVIVEAFRYDPLIGWKITAKGDTDDDIRIQHLRQDLYLDQWDQQQPVNTTLKLPQKGEAESTKHILNNIHKKLNGVDSQKGSILSESDHVDKLIKEAVSPLNLVQHYRWWCIFW